MFEMFVDAVTLFLRGKLFRDVRVVVRQAAIGAAVAAAMCLTMVFAGAPAWLAVSVASLAAGVLQPWLFKDLRYQ